MSTQERLTILREAAPNTWIAFSADEEHVVARGNTFEEVCKNAEQSGESDPVLHSHPAHLGSNPPKGMKVPYKLFPVDNDPGYAGAASTWMPILPVSLMIGHAKSPRLGALVDSAAFTTYFRSDIGKALGLKIEDGEPGELRGVVDGPPARVYYHHVKLCLAEHIIPIKAGFYDKLGFAGILGRHGFFELFNVSFDPSNNPPGLEITRIHRA